MAHLQSLECVPSAVRDRQRYVGDHVIRHYRPLGLATLLRDLGADPDTPELEIIGGIGRLVMRADGTETWEPSVITADPSTVRLGDPVPPPRVSPPDLAAARRAVCSTCDGWAGSCTVAGCSCNGMGQPGNLHSICPKNRWQS